MFQFNDLEGRTVVLTGATNGIGRALIPGLIAQGLNLILIGRDPARLETVVCEHQNTATTVEGVLCDLAIPQQRGNAAQRIGELAPVLDGIIHNAAIDPRQTLEKTTLELFRNVMATNVEPAMVLTRDLLPNLRQSKAGRVVNIGSITFELGTSLLSSYVASKGALVGLTRSLAHELGRDRITVNCIAPGVIEVEKEADRMTPELKRTILAGQSLQRILTPDDLLGVLCLLLSDAGGGITGQTITVDAGIVHGIASFDTQSPWLAE